MPDEVTIQSGSDPITSYLLRIRGDVIGGEASSDGLDREDLIFDEGGGVKTAVGFVASGGCDTIVYEGDVMQVKMHGGKASILLNGEEVTPDQLINNG